MKSQINSLIDDTFAKEYFFNMDNSLLEALRSGKPVTIVFLGDSTTEQNHYTAGEPGHVALIANKLLPIFGGTLTILNQGVSGDTSGDMLDRIETSVLRLNPDFIVISSGINDSLEQQHVENFQRNMEEMIRVISERTSARIILRTTSPVLGDNRIIRDELNPVLTSLAKTHGLGFIDTFRMIDSGEYDYPELMMDAYHPNGKGQEVIANTILYGLFFAYQESVDFNKNTKNEI